MEAWIARLFEDPEMVRMGHHQRKTDLNLGLGWAYYGLARVARPRTVVVIGSWRGFAPLVFAKALKDNGEGGEVVFIDPSLADPFWKDPRSVREHFASFGIDNIRHHLATTQQFVESPEFAELGEVGILFVDGMHTREQARFDHEAFESKLGEEALVLFHDSKEQMSSPVYGKGKEYVRDVCLYMDDLRKRGDLEVLELAFGRGVTLVRRPTVRPPGPPPGP